MAISPVVEVPVEETPVVAIPVEEVSVEEVSVVNESTVISEDTEEWVIKQLSDGSFEATTPSQYFKGSAEEFNMKLRG